MTVESRKSPRMPPPWFIRGAWAVHRALVRLTFGRLGIWNPKGRKWGTLRLRTVGRRTGRERVAILGYYEDGPNLVTLAMNGWMPGEPAWWLNLQDHPASSRTERARSAPGPRRATNAPACGQCFAERATSSTRWRAGDRRKPPS